MKREEKKKTQPSNLFWCKCWFLWPWFSGVEGRRWPNGKRGWEFQSHLGDWDAQFPLILIRRGHLSHSWLWKYQPKLCLTLSSFSTCCYLVTMLWWHLAVKAAFKTCGRFLTSCRDGFIETLLEAGLSFFMVQTCWRQQRENLLFVLMIKRSASISLIEGQEYFRRIFNSFSKSPRRG